MLQSTPDHQFRVEFFAHPGDPTTLNPRVGYLGYLDVATGDDGQATFIAIHPSPVLSVGDVVIATAMDRETGDTSEFSVVATTTELATSDASSVYGQPVDFTATVTQCGNPMTAGSVTFSTAQPSWPATSP